MRLSIPYPDYIYPSAYGPPTGNVNFCEIDHQFTPYVAEVINTLTNGIYIMYAFRGLLSLYRHKNLRPTTALPYFGLIAVGLGSALFHATQLKIPQLLDEIGMAIPTGAVLSQLLSYGFKDAGRSNAVYAASIASVTLVYAVHCVTFSNWLHYPAFGAMVIVVGWKCRDLMKKIEDATVRKRVRSVLSRARVYFVGAFGLWLVDRFFCNELIAARNWLGLPWGWLLELHGWWHIGTGMGAYMFIRTAQFLMDYHEGKQGMKVGKGQEVRNGNSNATKKNR